MKKVILFILTIFLSTAVFAQNKNLMYFDGSNDLLDLNSASKNAKKAEKQEDNSTNDKK